MKKWLFRIVAWVLIAIGVYGLIRCWDFVYNHTYEATKEQSDREYAEQIKPKIDERMSKLSLDDLTEAQRTNMEQIVKWSVSDYYLARDVSVRRDVLLFSVLLSLLSISLGLIVSLWGRVGELAKRDRERAEPPLTQ